MPFLFRTSPISIYENKLDEGVELIKTLCTGCSRNHPLIEYFLDTGRNLPSERTTESLKRKSTPPS
jgi:hypothetical protein